jgi:hypothetical protein
MKIRPMPTKNPKLLIIAEVTAGVHAAVAVAEVEALEAATAEAISPIREVKTITVAKAYNATDILYIFTKYNNLD